MLDPPTALAGRRKCPSTDRLTVEDEEDIERLRNHWMGLVVLLAEVVEEVQEGFGVAQAWSGGVEVTSLTDAVGHA